MAAAPRATLTTSSTPPSTSRARKGLRADEKLTAQRQTLTKAPYFSPANLLERLDPPGLADYDGLRADGARQQRLSTRSHDRPGRWRIWRASRAATVVVHERRRAAADRRRPIAVTAYAIRALKAYAPPGPRRGHDRAHRARDALARGQRPSRPKIATCSCSGCCGRGAAQPSAQRLAKVDSREAARRRRLGADGRSAERRLRDRRVAVRAGRSRRHSARARRRTRRASRICSRPSRPTDRGTSRAAPEVPAVLRQRVPIRPRSVDFVDGDGLGHGSPRDGAAVTLLLQHEVTESRQENLFERNLRTPCSVRLNPFIESRNCSDQGVSVSYS